MYIFQVFFSMIWYGGTTNVGAFPSSQSAQSNDLTPCAFGSPEPCQCPNNTIFQNSTTEVTIGANARDVAAILYSFFDVPWIGVDPVETTGEDLVVGSTRTMPLGGVYLIEEVLESWKTANGSYRLALGQKNVPIVMNDTYYFSGYWDDSEASYVNETHTKLVWHAHGCLTLPADFREFELNAINNTFKYLEERGQLVGNSTLPQTVVFPEFASGGVV
ncbi:hypothetical protein DM02DRAFT_655284 [Periconia macrospinosa]|uniref:Uncharacterized protein n=1 Tax=Periconia macrospinosa TaxID=97972 RepID=A0A2V1DRP9_9PLEO|nr:hypothetical protein DM02DRAFT_655284 [Periconia macrospinosa]